MLLHSWENVDLRNLLLPCDGDLNLASQVNLTVEEGTEARHSPVFLNMGSCSRRVLIVLIHFFGLSSSV